MNIANRDESRVAQQLVDIVHRLTGFRGELNADDNFLEVTGFSSIQVVRLAAELEGKFGIKFGAELGDFDALTSLRTLARFVVVRCP
jgi:acyl carrier protein